MRDAITLACMLHMFCLFHFIESVLDSLIFEYTRSFEGCPFSGEKAFTTPTVPLVLFQARFTVYRLCGWIDAARRVYGTPRFVALPAVHSHATPPVCCHYPRPRPGPAKNITRFRNNFLGNNFSYVC